MKNEIELGMTVGTGIGALVRKYLRAPITVLSVAVPVALLFPKDFQLVGLVIGLIPGVFFLRWVNKRWPNEARQADDPSAGMQAAAGLASLAVLLGDALKGMEDTPPLATGGGDSAPARKWQDGTGKTIEVAADGRLTYAGKFVGYRDAQGRITSGTGVFLGTLEDSGAMHGPRGDYKGRIFT